MITSLIYVQLYYYLSPWALEPKFFFLRESVRELEKDWTNKG